MNPKTMRNKKIRHFLIGVITGVIIWFVIDLIWDWKGNVDSYNKGYNAATNYWSEKQK